MVSFAVTICPSQLMLTKHNRAVILAMSFIYLRAGHTIYKTRKQLQSLGPYDLRSLSINDEELSTTAIRPQPDVEAANEHCAERILMKERVVSHVGSERGPGDTSLVRNSAAKLVHPQAQLSPTLARRVYGHYAGVTEQRPVDCTRRRVQALDKAAWSYTRCALLFFAAILITWTPSSANRVYTAIHGKGRSVTLEYMSALVLPLQGFWNAVIYAVTSWKACEDVFSTLLQSIYACWRRYVTGRNNQRVGS